MLVVVFCRGLCCGRGRGLCCGRGRGLCCGRGRGRRRGLCLGGGRACQMVLRAIAVDQPVKAVGDVEADEQDDDGGQPGGEEREGLSQRQALRETGSEHRGDGPAERADVVDEAERGGAGLDGEVPRDVLRQDAGDPLAERQQAEQEHAESHHAVLHCEDGEDEGEGGRQGEGVGAARAEPVPYEAREPAAAHGAEARVVHDVGDLARSVPELRLEISGQQGLDGPGVEERAEDRHHQRQIQQPAASSAQLDGERAQAGRGREGEGPCQPASERCEDDEERNGRDGCQKAIGRRAPPVGEQRPERVRAPDAGGAPRGGARGGGGTGLSPDPSANPGRPLPCLGVPIPCLRQRLAHPQRHQHRQHTDPEHPPPAQRRYDPLVDLGGQHRSPGVAGDEKARRPVAETHRPALQHVRGAGAVFAGHPHAQGEPCGEEAVVVPSEAAGEGPQRVQQDARDHRRLASVAVAHRAQHGAAEPARDEGTRDEARSLDRAEPEVVGYLGQYERDEDEVEAVQEVSQPGSEHRLPLGGGYLPVPGQA